MDSNSCTACNKYAKLKKDFNKVARRIYENKQNDKDRSQKNNRNRIFRYIIKCKTVSNPEITYELKISLPTVTQNTKELMNQGLIRETGELKSTGGRKAKVPEGRPCYCGKLGCLDAYCSAKRLSDPTGDKLQD